MPDLDQIKQEEQGRGTDADGLPRAAPAITPAGRGAAASTLLAPPGYCSPARARP
jgi:hypothetical protein